MKSECRPDTLKRRAISGDPTVLEEIFHCYRADLGALLMQRCGHRTDADDAMQEAFVAAGRYLSGYRGEASIKTWLYRLATSACTRMRRGRKNDPALHTAFDETAGGESHSDPAQIRVEEAIDARLAPLRNALAALAPTDRAVLILRDAEEMSTREVAETLNITEKAVKSRLYRARKSLRELLPSPD